VGELMGLGALMDVTSVGHLVSRLALDLVFAVLVIHVVYARLYGKQEFVFTCYLFNIVTLCLCQLLRKGPADLGVALTLFGVFGILRYRTEQIRSRDLTYLFVAIGLGIVNGVADRAVSVAELLVINGVIATATAFLEVGVNRHPETATPMLYDRLDLLQPGRYATLIEDIAARTGVNVLRVHTERIDLLRDAAEVTIYSDGPDRVRALCRAPRSARSTSPRDRR
jgi:hypothetical protein